MFPWDLNVASNQHFFTGCKATVSLNLCKWLEKDNLASYTSSFMPGSTDKLGIARS